MGVFVLGVNDVKPEGKEMSNTENDCEECYKFKQLGFTEQLLLIIGKKNCVKGAHLKGTQAPKRGTRLELEMSCDW